MHTPPGYPKWITIPLLWLWVIAGIGLAGWTDLSNPDWLEHDSTRPWSMGNISNAQRRTLWWILMFFLLIATTWRGLPYGVIRGHDRYGRVVERLRWFQILWPLKILTVLFHEICHAIVGTVTGGKVEYIGVNEGGATGFSPDRRYNVPWTLSAGYMGSCTLGCLMLLAGFNTLMSKIAALLLCVWILICLICCAPIKPKLFVQHACFRCRMHTANVTGQQRKAEVHRLASEIDRNGQSYKDRMVSLDIIVFVTLVFLIAIGIAWYLFDSIFLRYIMLFMGVGSSTYAIWDVLTDGVISDEGGSDCAAMADWYNGSNPPRLRTKRYYALWWFAVQILLAGITIMIGLAVFRSTTIEQAIQSRKLIPSPHRYLPADGRTLIQSTANALNGTMEAASDTDA